MNKTINIQKKPSRRKYIFAAGFILLLIIAALVFSMFQKEQESDPESERIIQKAVAKYLKKEPNDLTNEDYANIKDIWIDTDVRFIHIGMDIQYVEDPAFLGIPAIELSDTKLFEKFTNLRVLRMNNVKYPESKIPGWMKMLRKYGIINTANRFFIDVESLKGLSNLQVINFQGTSIKNIKPLSNLSNLRELTISNTHVTDLAPLKELKNLECLTITGCDKITDKQVKDLKNALPYLEIVR